MPPIPIHPFSNYVLKTYCMPGSVLNAREKSKNKRLKKTPAFREPTCHGISPIWPTTGAWPTAAHSAKPNWPQLRLLMFSPNEVTHVQSVTVLCEKH